MLVLSGMGMEVACVALQWISPSTHGVGLRMELDSEGTMVMELDSEGTKQLDTG